MQYFNPHSHKGSDEHVPRHIPIIIDFNPHSHKGSDVSALTLTDFGFKISIHTPTRGVTKPFEFIFAEIKISIHTPTRGVTV